jgi:hypothetical protein
MREKLINTLSYREALEQIFQHQDLKLIKNFRFSLTEFIYR